MRAHTPKAPFGHASIYLRNQFDHLLAYLDDGLVPIDDNKTEQLMKQAARGRKNWMFIGSVEAGYRAADLMSIVSSAHRKDLDVFFCVKDGLGRLMAGETKCGALRRRLEARSSGSAGPAGGTAVPCRPKAEKRARRRVAKGR